MPYKNTPNVRSIVPFPQTPQEEERLRRKQEIGDTIRDLRMAKGLTQAQLADILGVTKNAVTNWELGFSRPEAALVVTLCKTLDCSSDKLFGIPEKNRLTEREKAHLHMYRNISRRDQHYVDVLMKAMMADAAKEIERECLENFTRIEHLQFKFSAGTGNPLDNTAEDPEYDYVRLGPEASQADVIVTVTGDSMAPTFYDGDDLLIKRADDIEYGEIGLFIVAGDGYVKEYQPDGLHSHNPKYKTIHPTEDDHARCVGKVLCAVTEDMRPSVRETHFLDEHYNNR